MPSQLHEVLVAMLRENAALVRMLADWAVSERIPSSLEVRTRDQSYSEIRPPEYRADLVVELVSPQTSQPTMMLILEVQLHRDPKKRFAWPAYQAVLRAQYGCPAMIVVLAPDPSVAGWCARPIDLDGHGMSVVRPKVIGPDQIPVVTNLAQAEQSPSIAALSAVAHGRGPHALEIGRAGLRAAATLDGPDAALYTDLVLHHLDVVARRALEREMALKLKNKYEYQSSTARRFFAEGEAEGEARGKARGRAEGKARALLVLLEARGFHLEASAKRRIEAVGADELDALIARAATIDDLDELFVG